MSKLRTVLFAVAACAALAACKMDAADPAADMTAPQPVIEEGPTSEQAPPVEPPADAVMPVTVSADAVKVGSSLGPDQAASAPKPSYSLADTVYASARTSGRGTAYVYWTYEDGISHKDEQKPVSGNIVSFEFNQADGMKPGKYNVEIGVDDKPIGIVDFVVR